MSDTKNVVKAIYENKPKMVRESLNNIIAEKAGQILENLKQKLAKNLFSEAAKWRSSSARMDNPQHDPDLPDDDYSSKYKSKGDVQSSSGLHARTASKYAIAQSGARKGKVTRAHTTKLKSQIKDTLGKKDSN